jgi:methyl-accepting chemotaxis protein
MNWKNWHTRAKLFFGFGTVVVLSVITAIISIWNSLDNSKKVEQLKVSDDAKQYFIICQLNTRAYVDLKDTSYYSKAKSAMDLCLLKNKQLKEVSSIAETISAIDTIINLLNNYNASLLSLHNTLQTQNVIAQRRKDTRNTYIKEFEKEKLPRDNDINYNFNEGRLNAVYLLASISDDNYKKAMNALNKSKNEAIRLNKNILEKSISDYQSTIVDYYNTGVQLKSMDEKLKAVSGKIGENQDKVSQSITDYIENSNQQSIIKVIIMSAISVLFSMIIAFVITQYLTNSIKKSTSIAEALASGNLMVDIEFSADKSSKDELSKLNETLHTMDKKMREVITEIYAGANSVAGASREINSTTQQISQGANMQASSVEEVSSSIEQLASNIQLNADNAQQTEKIALITASGVKNLSSTSEKSLESVRQIAGKINIINDIAFQTNILALNAAVEAARAGELGRGFAVVAAEVRKLAEHSKIAATEIMELSASSLQNTEEAVAEMLNLIPQIEKTAGLVQEITASSKEQSNGTEQVNQAIQQLNSVTQQNAASSEELASSAEQLANQANQLRAAVSFFKIKQDAEIPERDFATPKSAPMQKPLVSSNRPAMKTQRTPKETEEPKPVATKSKGINLKLDTNSDADFERY